MNSLNPEDVIKFWSDAGSKKWYVKDDAFDAEIAEKFGAAHDGAKAGQYDDWQETAQGAMALLILLDQMARNLFRNSHKAFEADAKALGVAKNALERKFDEEIEGVMRQWFYMPLMHSEAMSDQELCCEITKRVGLEGTYEFAVIHADIIRQFGRFPHRNEILGRTSSADELAFLAKGGFAG